MPQRHGPCHNAKNGWPAIYNVFTVSFTALNVFIGVRIHLAAFFSRTFKAHPVPDPVPPLSPYAWKDMTVSQIFLGQSRCGIASSTLLGLH
jgi:hypothetical protein